MTCRISALFRPLRCVLSVRPALLGVVFLLSLGPLTKTGHASTAQTLDSAISLMQEHDYQQALVLLRDLERRVLNPSQLSNLFASAYLGRGYQLLSSANLTASAEAFQEGRRYNPDDIRLWQGESMVLLKQGRYADAAALLEQALGIAPQSAELYHLLGKAYYADGRMPEALDALAESRDLGGGEDVSVLLEKVTREWQVEMLMEQDVRGHFQLSFVDVGQSENLASDVLEVLEDAYTDLGSVLDYYPEVRVPVLLYLKNDFTLLTQSPHWAGGVYDGKIRLPLGGVHRMSDQLAAVLYHEYMHVMVHFMANRKAPVWLNEGLAELSGRRQFHRPVQHLPKAFQDNQLLGWDTLAKPFSRLAEDKVLLAYEQSYSLVHFMVDRYGWHRMTELLGKIGTGQPWQSAIAIVYQEYGLDWPAILVEWRAAESS